MITAIFQPLRLMRLRGLTQTQANAFVALIYGGR